MMPLLITTWHSVIKWLVETGQTFINEVLPSNPFFSPNTSWIHWVTPLRSAVGSAYMLVWSIGHGLWDLLLFLRNEVQDSVPALKGQSCLEDPLVFLLYKGQEVLVGSHALTCILNAYWLTRLLVQLLNNSITNSEYHGHFMIKINTLSILWSR
jgi:hypothetical protein